MDADSSPSLPPQALPPPAAPVAPGAPPPNLGRPARLARIEVLDSHGHPLQAHDVHAWPVRIGRALDNDLVLADPHVAAHHAELAPDEHGALRLRTLPSRNGARIEHPHHLQTIAGDATAALPPEARARLGRTLLRVQRAEDPLPEEQPLEDGAAGAARGWRLPLLLALTLLWQGLSMWLEARPDTKPLEQAAPLLGLGGGLVIWAGGWGLMTKLFAGRFVMLPHLRLALVALLLSAAAGALLPALAFMLDLPLLSRLRGPVNVALAAWLVARHLALVAPRQARRMAVGVVLMALLALGYQMAGQWQRSDRLFGELYSTMLLPPALRLVPAEPVADAVRRLQALEAPLTERARQAREDEFEPQE